MSPHTFKFTAIAAFFATSIAFADEGNKSAATEMKTVEVIAKHRSTRTEKRNSYTTSAMRTTTGLALSPRETPQSVSVITKTQLEDQGISQMDDAMKTTTGINVVRGSGDGRTRYQSRGFYIDQIEEDGITTTVGGSSSNPVRDPQSMTDLAIYDHIEVVRGPTGLTQANGEPGGTINAVRKKPTSARQLEAEVSVNRWGTVRGVTDVSGSLNKAQTLRGRFVGVLEKNESFKDRVDGKSGLIYGVMDAQIGDNSLLTWGAMYQRKSSTPDWWGVPMGPNGSDTSLPRSTYLGLDWSETTFEKINLFSEFEHYFSEDWKLNAKINYLKNDSESLTGALYNGSTSYAGWTPGSTLPLQWLSNYVNDGKQIAFQANLTGKYDLFGRRHELFSGYTYSYENSNSHRRQFVPTQRFDPLRFNGNEVPEPNWDQGANYGYEMFYNTKITSHAWMLGSRFSLRDNLHMLAGTRYTHWRYTSYDDYSWYNGRIDNDPTDTTERVRNRFIPYFGLTWDINSNHSLYASYTSIFKPSAAKDRSGNYLPPVMGNNYEIGWKTSWHEERLNTALALFNIDQKNRTANVQDPSNRRWYNEPIGRVRSRGFDAEISGNLTDNWKLFAGYTYNRSKYLETDNPRNALYTKGANYSLHTPRQMLRLYTSYRLPGAANRWTIGGGVSAQSRINSLGNIRQSGYALWNANIQYQINEQLKISLIGTNLTDRRYYETNRTRYNGINNFFGEPRSFMLKLNWQL